MGQVYFAVYAPDDELGVRVLQEDALLQPEEVSCAGLSSCFAAGPGWLAYPELRDRFAGVMTGLDAGLRPSATDVATLAWPSFCVARLSPPALALPNYLRDRVTSVNPRQLGVMSGRMNIRTVRGANAAGFLVCCCTDWPMRFTPSTFWVSIPVRCASFSAWQ